MRLACAKRPVVVADERLIVGELLADGTDVAKEIAEVDVEEDTCRVFVQLLAVEEEGDDRKQREGYDDPGHDEDDRARLLALLFREQLGAAADATGQNQLGDVILADVAERGERRPKNTIDLAREVFDVIVPPSAVVGLFQHRMRTGKVQTEVALGGALA